MKCPTCGQHTPDAWRHLVQSEDEDDDDDLVVRGTEGERLRDVHVDWMHCANDDCRELVMRVHESYPTMYRGEPVTQTAAMWMVRPRGVQRQVNPDVPKRFRDDYLEAARILNDSPRMSAVLSRRVLADLLEEYAGLGNFSLTARIDKFIADTRHPIDLRRNLHYLREIGDFSAHTQRNGVLEVVGIDPLEAEWTLDIIDRLFAYLIESPNADEQVRLRLDEKIKAAGRRPIKPLPEDAT